MDETTAEDREAAWIVLLCAGVLLTALAATVSVGIIALYAVGLADLQPVLACFAAGALLMLAAAAGLERANVARVRAERR